MRKTGRTPVRLLAVLLCFMLLIASPVSVFAEGVVPAGGESEPVGASADEGTSSQQDAAGEADASDESEAKEEDDVAPPQEEAVAPAEDDVGEAAPDEEGDGPAMPEDYTLSSSQIAQKSRMASMDMEAVMGAQEEGVDYQSGTIIYIADTREEAALIAEGYNAELIKYEYGIATAKIRAMALFSVAEAVEAGATPNNNLPPVWPNHILRAHGLPAKELAPLADVVHFPGSTIAFPLLDNTDILFDDPDQYDYPWYHDAIGSQSAWQQTTGVSGVLVAVLDTGIDYDHEEFTHFNSGNETLEYYATATMDGEEGSPTLDEKDINGHGTHVAGIISAGLDNGTGAAGIAPGVSLLSVKVLEQRGEDTRPSGYTDEIARGLIYATVTKKADIVNMSLGGSWTNEVMKTAVERAQAAGALLIASAGNEGDTTKNYPAGYAGVVSVAATRENGTRAGFSTYGSWVTLSAPGVNIISTVPNNGYELMNGTSMAAPVVTGVAALVKSAHPGLTADQLKARLTSSVNKVASTGMGKGIVSAQRALGLAPPNPAFRLDYPADFKPAAKDSYYTGTLQVELHAGTYDTVYYTLDGKTPNKTTGTEYDGDSITIPGPGKKTLKAIAYDQNGKASGVVTAIYTMVRPSAGVTITAKNGATEITAGKTLQLTATVLPADTTNKKVTWKLVEGDPKHITVSSTGLVTVKKTATDATIKIRATPQDGVSTPGEYELDVRYITDISITGASQLATGCKTTMKATVLPADFFNKTVTWHLNVPKEVATVDSKGVITVKAGATVASIEVYAQSAFTLAGAPVRSEPHTITIKTGKVTKVSLSQAEKRTLLYTAGEVEERQFQLAAAFEGTGDYSEDLVWTSSNPKVATVDEDGVVTAVARGKATITATAADGTGKKGTYGVTVQVPVTSLSLSAPYTRLAASRSMTLKADLAGAGGLAPDNKAVTWSVDFAAGQGEGHDIKKIATISTKGVLTAVKNLTEKVTVTVTAAWAGKPSVDDTFEVTLYPEMVTAVVLEDAKAVRVIYTAGTNAPTTVPLSAQANGKTTGQYYTGLVWTSSNQKVATVDEDGVVAAVGRGKATITATAADGSGKKVSCSVTVQAPASDVDITAPYAHLGATRTMTLKPVFTGVGGVAPDNKTVTWSVAFAAGEGVGLDIKNFATISTKGVLTAVKNLPEEMKVTVTATWAGYTEVKDTFEVTVYPEAATSVTIEDAKAGRIIYTAGTDAPPDVVLDARVNGKTAGQYYTGLVWTSSNPKVATVDTSGRVISVGRGKATITATAADGSGKKATCSVTVQAPASSVDITAPYTELAASRSMTLKATLAGAGTAPDNKAVLWSVAFPDGYQGPQGPVDIKDYATISSKGVLTIKKTFKQGGNHPIVVTAAWAADPRVHKTFEVEIYPTVASSVAIPLTGGSYYVRNNTLELFTRNYTSANKTRTKQLNAQVLNAAKTDEGVFQGVVWKSSNSKVVTVDENGLLTAQGPGTATITATAQDGTAKAGSVKVRVDVPASRVRLYTNYTSMYFDDYTEITAAFGKQVKVSAQLGTTFGTPTNKKVIWTLGATNCAEAYMNCSVTPAGVFSSKAALANTGWFNTNDDSDFPWVEVKGTTDDGTNLKASVRIYLSWPAKYVEKVPNQTYRYDPYSGEFYNRTNRDNPYYTEDGGVDSIAFLFWDKWLYGTLFDVTVTSSNVNVVNVLGAVPVTMEGYDYHCAVIYLRGNGTANLTMKANDGTGKTATIKITVTGVPPGYTGQNANGNGYDLQTDGDLGQLHITPPQMQGARPDGTRKK